MPNSIYHGLLILVVVSGLTPSLAAQNELQVTNDEKIKEYLLEVVERQNLPGIVAGIAQPGRVRLAAAGVRKFGDDTKITIDDKMHLGSCTKAITATMIGRLVDQRKMKWEQTIGQTLPQFAAAIHEDYASVTLLQLLGHRSGMPANARWRDPAAQNAKDMTERRTRIAVAACRKKPKHVPGTKYAYSNLGYVVAALMAAKITGRDWETLVRTEIFEPNDMKSAGFGSPATKNEVAQPWGHRLAHDTLEPTLIDNAPTLGPAGTVHASLEDWTKFLLIHADDTNDFISAQTRKRIKTPLEGQPYALGWIVAQRPWAGGTALTHSGSNTVWFCTVWVAPKNKRAYLAATNCAGGKTAQVIDGVIGKLIELDQK